MDDKGVLAAVDRWRASPSNLFQVITPSYHDVSTGLHMIPIYRSMENLGVRRRFWHITLGQRLVCCNIIDEEPKMGVTG